MSLLLQQHLKGLCFFRDFLCLWGNLRNKYKGGILTGQTNNTIFDLSAEKQSAAQVFGQKRIATLT